MIQVTEVMWLFKAHCCEFKTVELYIAAKLATEQLPQQVHGMNRLYLFHKLEWLGQSK